MASEDAREVRRVTDFYGAQLIIGRDHGMTTLDTPPEGVTLDAQALGELLELLDRAAVPGQVTT